MGEGKYQNIMELARKIHKYNVLGLRKLSQEVFTDLNYSMEDQEEVSRKAKENPEEMYKVLKEIHDDYLLLKKLNLSCDQIKKEFISSIVKYCELRIYSTSVKEGFMKDISLMSRHEMLNELNIFTDKIHKLSK